jgi:hypothetical protein
VTPFRKPAVASGIRTPDFKRRFSPAVEAVDAAEAPEGTFSGPTLALAQHQTATGAPSRVDLMRADLSPRPRDRAEAESPGTAIAPMRGRAIAIPTRVMGLVRDTAAGVLLCQLIYWTRRGVDVLERDGWVYKTAGEWQQETGMSWKVQRRARGLLQALDLIEERKQEMPARLEFRLKLSTLAPLLAERAELALDRLDLARFRDGEDSIADDLIGRAFLFHGGLAKVFPLHSAMMCSRLLAPARLASLDAQAMVQAAGRGNSSYTRLVTLQREEWHAETGLSRDQWQTARRNLRDAGVLIERKHNFPRRVDLAVNLRALSEVLRQSASRPYDPAEAGRAAVSDVGAGEAAAECHSRHDRHYRQDRAKQASGFRHRPIQPSRSPDPADTDSPILPIGIAQSRLYPLGLQSSLHPQPQSAGATAGRHGPNQPSPAMLWGGGGFYEVIKTEYRLTGQGSPSPSAEPPALAWPGCFSQADRAQAAAHLAGLDRAIQQQLLDEIDWQSTAGKPVRSPVALVRTLARKALAGEFVPDGAHRVAEARQRAQLEEAQRRLAAERRAAEAAEGPAPSTDEGRAARERLKAATEQLRRRQA